MKRAKHVKWTSPPPIILMSVTTSALALCLVMHLEIKVAYLNLVAGGSLYLNSLFIPNFSRSKLRVFTPHGLKHKRSLFLKASLYVC